MHGFFSDDFQERLPPARSNNAPPARGNKTPPARGDKAPPARARKALQLELGRLPQPELRKLPLLRQAPVGGWWMHICKYAHTVILLHKIGNNHASLIQVCVVYMTHL